MKIDWLYNYLDIFFASTLL
ncbi:hypothetical protein CGLO_01118 [Colletotrichum gloeosporioides Cg-14]|uniref:Uncharacterized protein n=1 Tax=Colletotrichum gloeosporioides (strain Cg-14) TaxID=1237896 RepID=T0MCB6_COLGC|nr:hypothetical protein CGLO_01118 [Colletotrichum gloeosporioides Cg-14]